MMAKKTRKQLEDEAWDRIMQIAEEHSMILDAAAGVATLAHPDVQRERGFRAEQLHKTHRWTMAECTAAAERGE
jgi:hypothetical protein